LIILIIFGEKYKIWSSYNRRRKSWWYSVYKGWCFQKYIKFRIQIFSANSAMLETIYTDFK
jgi:hypothetical protein